MWGFYFVLYLLVLVFSDVPGSRRNLVGISWLFGSSPPTLFQTFLLLYSFSSPSSMPLIHTLCLFCCCSVSHVWLWPQGLQHTRLSCPSPSPGAYSHSCPLSRWCHQTISSSAIPFISCLQFFPASGSFLMSQLFASSGQSVGASVSASVLSMNIQGFTRTVSYWVLGENLSHSSLFFLFCSDLKKKQE